ncbi:hypothetical protein LT330_009779 [Penicillium expansum]|uniref:Sin3 binding protein n=1 Tax=Penicillium expansum TaxID=27334 RepID=A0A0A2JQE0_PENEN|nr:Sin3 binding protein [Penicillium expansum]KAK4864516.1 hypothetical protein LT330_009779 [Penicillium expansum]KGO47245.1 Sin3 binding protein [Penicillium expansum]KGO54475.1 Sin3 binding protein [Penicillium expansum]KGO60036.1 Sin3 binding protein [Penicillium expansum]
MAFHTNSSIAMALAGKTASVDIPQRRSGLSGGRVPAMLPTPPNSISPTLPPQTFKHRATLSPGSPLSTVPQLDSDIDLEDAEHDNGHHVSLPVDDLDSTGAITPAMLSKHHLPEILLEQGPLAIRHVMGHLTASVPGFSHIPPAKARRLVVAALEGRGNGGEAGGVQGDVVFEKIGWGRWDARRRGEPAHDRDLNASSSPPSSVAGSFQQRGLQIQGQSGWQGGNRHPYRMSFAESTAFSYTDDYGMHGDLDMLEHEADKMSLDGDDGEYCSSSEAPDEMQENEWVEGDDTDEEDWAQIGADALRARSMNNNGSFINGHVAARAKPQPSGIFPATCPSVAKLPPRTFDIQERAAVEALLRLGSM